MNNAHGALGSMKREKEGKKEKSAYLKKKEEGLCVDMLPSRRVQPANRGGLIWDCPARRAS